LTDIFRLKKYILNSTQTIINLKLKRKLEAHLVKNDHTVQHKAVSHVCYLTQYNYSSVIGSVLNRTIVNGSILDRTIVIGSILDRTIVIGSILDDE
jgi:hypothetical protein